MTKIAIVTVDYNGHADTWDLLTSARKLDTDGLVVKWVVVDNGSAESVKKAGIVDEFPYIDWLQTGMNLGYAGGYNVGLRYAESWDADYVLVINNDAVIGDDKLLVKLVAAIEAGEKIGVVSPKILFAKGFEFHKDRYKKSESGKVIWYGGGRFDWANVMGQNLGLDEVDRGQYDRVAQTDFISGCCFLVRTEVLRTVGYFREQLFAYFEDGDWMMRLAAAGWKKVYAGNTHIYHKVSRTSGIGSEMTDYLITRNRLWFGLKYGHWRTKQALVKQATRFLLWGRPAQRRGVLDFWRGRWGYPGQPVDTSPKDYPLKLSVVAVNYKTRDLFLALLQSLYKPDSGLSDQPSEVIALDNASNDGLPKVIAANYPQVIFIQNAVNAGFVGGYNRVMARARGEYVLLLNSDIEVKPGALSEMVRVTDELGGKVVTGCRLYFPDGTLQYSCFNLPTIWGAIKEYFLGITGSYFMWSPKSKSRPVPVEGLVMSCYLIPRWVISKVGVLSEKIFTYFEDVDYCRRLKKHGIPLYYIPTAAMIHHHGAASKKLGRDKARQQLEKSAVIYHGRVRYALLWLILWLGQKWGKVRTPRSRWEDG